MKLQKKLNLKKKIGWMCIKRQKMLSVASTKVWGGGENIKVEQF